MDKEEMTLEEKVEYLEKRVSHLETIERNRKIRAIVTLIMRILVYIAIGIALVFAWNYVNENYIKPYKETVEEIQDIKEETTDKITGIFKKNQKK